jgi:hypothetical protein
VVDLEPTAEQPQSPEASANTSGEAESPANTCYRCDAPSPEGTLTCSECGQKQYRTCFCGNRVRADLDHCPICGADWSSKVKVRRRSRSVHVKPRTLLRSALIGALLTVMCSALLNIVITAMAERSRPAGAVALSFSARLYYAWQTLASAFDALFTRLLGGLGIVLLTALAGAVLGTLFYLLRAGYWRSKKHRSSHSLNRRRRSR